METYDLILLHSWLTFIFLQAFNEVVGGLSRCIYAKTLDDLCGIRKLVRYLAGAR